VPYAKNAKKHDDRQVAAIAGSIREFGFTNPVLIDGQDGIIAGHGRVLAAQKLGLASVPCIRLAHLTDAQRRAYILADNRLTETGGGWDADMLAAEVEAIDWEELESFGLDDMDLGGVLNELEQPDFQPGTEEEQGKLNELAPKMVECPHCKRVFDSRGHEQG